MNKTLRGQKADFTHTAGLGERSSRPGSNVRPVQFEEFFLGRAFKNSLQHTGIAREPNDPSLSKTHARRAGTDPVSLTDSVPHGLGFPVHAGLRHEIAKAKKHLVRLLSLQLERGKAAVNFSDFPGGPGTLRPVTVSGPFQKHVRRLQKILLTVRKPGKSLSGLIIAALG